MSVVSLSESQVKDLLNWPLVYEAVEQSLRSITETRTDNSQPTAVQPTRIFTPTPNGKGLFLLQSARSRVLLFQLLIC